MNIIAYSGLVIDPENIIPANITRDDIAHALAHQCRYNGHTVKFYSVAEHSYLMSTQVSKPCVIHALLHDAAEAYTGDITTPVKRLFPAIAEMEERILAAIYEHFNIFKPSIAERQEIKDADIRMLRTERDRLFQNITVGWPPEVNRALPYTKITIDCWTPYEAKTNYRRMLDHVLKNYLA